MSIHFTINDMPVSAEAGEMIADVAARYGIEIPTLCHDPKVKSYGACGMCVIEAKNGGKLLRSCSTEVNARTEGMAYYTETPRVVQARKIALELLMTDHVGDCRPPCMLACPAETDCQGYVGLIANGMHDEAVRLIMEKIPLPASIGRVCPHPCEKQCRRGKLDEPISIASLKRFAADVNLAKGTAAAVCPGGEASGAAERSSGKKVAVVGGGPAGLTVAAGLAAKGHDVTVYEAMPELGGMLRYGIPEYRLPKAVLDAEIDVLRKLGVRAKTGVRLPEDITLAGLRAENDAVVVAVGAWVSSRMRVPGEDLAGVIGGIDFLREVALGHAPQIGTRVAVCGGGNTAMDACRTAVRVGAKNVYTLYRRTRAEMPAEDVEIREAEEEGVEFRYLCSPVEILGDGAGRVQSVKVQRMELGEPDASGRRSPVPVEGAYEILPVDTVIMAIGQGVNAKGLEELERTRKNTVVADEETFETSVPGVFACGDVTNKGPGIAIAAIGEAQKAVRAVDAYLAGGSEGVAKLREARRPYLSRRELTDEQVRDLYADRHAEPDSGRVQMAHDGAVERKTNFREYMKGFTPEEAQREAMRCLECGCMDYFECKLARYAGMYDVQPERFRGLCHNRQQKTASAYFTRDPDKCILCGLCVRACEEITGQTILGLVGRGFDTLVQPEMGLPLSETPCLSCGLCVSVCPTGALTEKTPLAKQVPLREEVRDITCHMCSAACGARAALCGTAVTRILPQKGADGDVLCARGRFEQAGVLSGADQEAYVRERLAALRAAGVTGPVAFLVGTSCKNGQLDAILHLAAELPDVAFVSSVSVGRTVPEGQRASAEYAATHNGRAAKGQALEAGYNRAGCAARGITALLPSEAALLQSGAVAVLVSFADDLSGLSVDGKVHILEAKAEI